MKNKKNEMKELTKDMNQEQKEIYKEELLKKKEDKQVKLKLENKLLKNKEKEAYKKSFQPKTALAKKLYSAHIKYLNVKIKTLQDRIKELKKAI